MSDAWHYFVIIGTVGTFIALFVLLFGSRKVEQKPDGDGTTGHEYDGIQELDNPLPAWWLGMFAASIVFGIGYLIYYPGLGNVEGLGGWTSADQVADDAQAFEARFAPFYARLAQQDVDSLVGDRRAMQVGRRLFLNNCATCHGSAGKGSIGFPNLTDDEWIWGAGYDAIRTAIMNGRVAVMPGWQAALGDDGVRDTTEYVMQLSGAADVDTAAAERGAKHYALYCVACHGPSAAGNPMLGAPDLNNDAWLYGGNREAIASAIANGLAGNMPAQEQLGAERAHVLAAYVSSLSATQ